MLGVGTVGVVVSGDGIVGDAGVDDQVAKVQEPKPASSYINQNKKGTANIALIKSNFISCSLGLTLVIIAAPPKSQLVCTGFLW